MPNKPVREHEAFPVLLLAAGASRRLGRAKALLSMGREILLERAIDQAAEFGGRVTIVVGGDYPLIRYRCRRSAPCWRYAPDWEEGMAASLRFGIRSLGPHAKGVFVMLMDQPLIVNGDLAYLARVAREAPDSPVAADIHGRPGAPAYIPRRLWSELLKLEGDRGAAAVLLRHRARTLPVNGVFDDVDTMAEWQRISASYRKRYALAVDHGV